MAGLLYKDFVGIRGQRVLLILFGCTLVFMVLRLLFPGTDFMISVGVTGSAETISSVGMVENEAGELAEITVGELRDSFLVMPPLLFIVVGLSLIPTWTAAICRHDEKNGTRRYVATLPLSKNAYIASKYLFIGIAVYILFSLDNIWIIIYNSVAGDNNSSQCLRTLSQFLMAFCGLILLLAAIELPFFITFGVKKGMLVKTALIEGAAFLGAAYLFFGNLKVFRHFNITVFMNWCEQHLVIVALISILSPIAELFLFWLSYQVTCRINQNREAEIYG